LTKIKTIGDAYMVVGGVPTPVEDHADRVLSFSVAMIQAVEGFNQNRPQNRQVQVIFFQICYVTFFSAFRFGSEWLPGP
jgi:class 3 adenylate cyclase